MKNKELLIKTAFWTIWTALVAICVYYIVHNAQWLVRDDAIVISHTGFGKAFLLSDMVNPPLGRFYPFAYLPYNVLLLFNDGYIGPHAHYVLHAVFFVVFVIAVTILLLRILSGQKALYKYLLAFLAVVVFVGRVYIQYTECYSTSWCGYTIEVVFLLFTVLFYEKGKWIFGIMALLCINYFCYCGESGFVLPLSMGACALLFQRKTLSVREKVFNWLLVGSALLFLALYAILVLPHIESAYDGAHGESVGLLENAVRMLWTQKLLVLALVLLVARLVDILRNNKEYTLYDIFLLTAAACCMGNFILRLNWALYYNGAAMLTIPSILYFSLYYLKGKWTMGLFVLLALFYGRKIPDTIQQNQHRRIETYERITFLSNCIDEGVAVVWYEPEVDEYSYDLELRTWRYNAINTYLGWWRHEPEFSLDRATECNPIENSIWLSSTANDVLFPNDSCLLVHGKLLFYLSAIKGYRVSDGN